MLNSIATELVVTIIVAIATSLFWFGWNYYKNNDRFLTFLGFDFSIPLTICYGNVQSGSSDRYTSPLTEALSTPQFDYGDIDATLATYDRLASKFQGRVNHVANDIPDVARKDNLVSIGGPKWNKLSQSLIGRSGSPFYYSPGTQGLIEKRRNHQIENVYKFTINENNDGSLDIEDYGCLIVARQNSIGSQIPAAVIISGYSTFGVLLAARFFSEIDNRTVRKMKQTLRDSRRFGIIVKGTISLSPQGRIVRAATPQLVSWIPEQDFHEPYQYRYD